MNINKKPLFTRYIHRVIFVITLSFLILFSGRAIAEPGLSHQTESGRILLNVSGENGGYLQQTHSVSVQPGTNRIRVALGSFRVVPDSLLLVPGSQRVRVKGVKFKSDQAAVWTLESRVESVVPVTVYARLRGLTSRTSYRVLVREDEGRLNLRATITLFNQTKMSLDKAWVGLGYGSWLKTVIEPNETKRFQQYGKTGVPYRKVYRVANAASALDEEFSALPVYYEFSNTSRSRLGDRALRSGRIRFYTNRKDNRVFLGEARTDYVPVGDSVTVSVGKSNDVRAKRRVVNRNRTHIRRNRHRQVQLYDEIKTVQYTVENNTRDPAHIRLVEALNGQWTIRNATLEYRRPSNRELLLEPTVEPAQKRTFRVTIETKNIMPNNR